MRHDLPTGTVTFLFTDVEGSTKLLAEIGDEAYEEALAEHRGVVRDACAEHGGVEVDTQGDAFFFAFPTAPGALAAASHMTAALASGPIHIRIGLHTGEPRLGEEGFVGREVHFAARVAATGHGGQIVLSSATAELLPSDNSSEGNVLTDLGEHRLKDIEGAVQILQLGEERFPPLKTISNTNLPRPASSFVGRERELEDVLAKVEQGARLLTLTGPGGSGKTRLALEAAATLVPAYKAGVFWVGLASLRDPALVTEQIAQTLGAKDGLAEHVAEREMLLLLDNLEQVVEAAPELSQLLEACPNLTLLCTSRELLRVHGEVEYPVPPLASPEAVSLFSERSGLRPTEEIPELCARLDNLPLAVELAAARTKALSPAQILDRLSQRLDLLKGGRDADPRQQTLRATIEWSYRLLQEDDQRLFRALSVFAGGCTLEAAEEVCEADLDTLHSLVEKSLVRFSNERYWMLETIREYAGERLEEAGEDEMLQGRHRAYFLSLAERDEPTGRDQRLVLDRLSADYDNLRDALASYASLPEGAPEALRLASALVLFWFIRGFYREGLEWLEPILALTKDERTEARAGALWGAGFLKGILGDESGARPLLQDGLELARALGDKSRAARCLNMLGLLAFFRNDVHSSRALFEESTQLARAADDRWCLADALATLGSIYPLQGELTLANDVASEALVLARRDHDDQGIRMALFALALAAVRQGEFSAATKFGTEGLDICRRIGDLWFVSYFQWVLATTASASGDHGSARVRAEESLSIARDLEAPLLLVCALDAMAVVAREDGADDDAEAHLREAEAIGDATIVPDSYRASVYRGLGELALARGDLADAESQLETSLRLATAVDDSWEAARARSLLGTLDQSD